MKHFSIFEFFPHCSSEEVFSVLKDKQLSNNLICLAFVLDYLRDEFGSAIAISSGYRSPAHNKAVGGSSSSQHLNISACDIYPCSKSLDSLFDFISKCHIQVFGQVIYYHKKHIIHVALPSEKYPTLTISHVY